MDTTSEFSMKREPSGGDEDWSQHAEADDSQRLPSSLRIEAHRETSQISNHSSNADGDDVDDWSQQHDNDHIHRMPSSLIVEDDMDDMDVSRNPSINELSSEVAGVLPDHAVDILDNEPTPASGLTPKRAEPTLKEKLVERERQRRAETERARLKRQFALSSNGGSAVDEEGNTGIGDGSALRENGSVAGTIGEGSIVAFVDVEEEEDQKLTYPMKRFLQEQGNIVEEQPLSRESAREVNQGVVMERFLKEPVLVSSSNEQVTSTEERANVDRSVSFDMDLSSSVAFLEEPRAVPGDGLSADVPVTSAGLGFTHSEEAFLNTSVDVGTSATASIANASVTCLPPPEGDSEVGDLEAVSNASALDDMDARAPSLEIQSVPESPSVDRSTSSDQPRVLRLTEAEIQEMAAIDEASRSNAPPSDRDTISESSFVGELVSDFGGHGVDTAGTLSQGTPTTAMESASIASGNHSTRPMSEDVDDQNSIDELANESISSHAAGSSTGGNVSVTANPPSDIGGDDVAPSLIPDQFQDASIPVNLPIPAVSEIVLQQTLQTNDEATDDLDLRLPADDCKIVNRMIRPGMVTMNRTTIPDILAPSTPIRRSLSAPDSMHFDVDGFDFDKNAPASPGMSPFGAIREVGADDIWSPGSRMSASPYPSEKFRNYGTSNGSPVTKVNAAATARTLLHPRVEYDGETEPLMPQIPKEIVASPQRREIQNLGSNDIFSSLRLTNAAGLKNSDDGVQNYIEKSIFERALSGRIVPLVVTFLMMIVVLLIIVGGSDRICALIGRPKYQLLLGLLPVCCAISGNVGLQSSNLTKQAIAHGYVTRFSYKGWIFKEIGASGCLGLALGILVGLITTAMSGYDIIFGLTIMMSQFVSIVTAGITGCLAPIFLPLIFKQNSSHWSGLLETTIQDIVGSFTMIIFSYNILLWFSSYDNPTSALCA